MLDKIRILKKLLLASLILCNQCYAIGAAGHAASHGSTHVSESAHVAETESAISTRNMAFLATSGHAAQQMNHQNVTALPTNASGVMTCSAFKVPNGKALVYDGCSISQPGWDTPDTQLSIQQYFDKNKPHYDSKIVMVIFENHDFYIYYS